MRIGPETPHFQTYISHKTGLLGHTPTVRHSPGCVARGKWWGGLNRRVDLLPAICLNRGIMRDEDTLTQPHMCATARQHCLVILLLEPFSCHCAFIHFPCISNSVTKWIPSYCWLYQSSCSKWSRNKTSMASFVGMALCLKPRQSQTSNWVHFRDLPFGA